MSIYSYLKHDHQEVKKLMTMISDLGDRDQQKKWELFNSLKENLIIHAKAEEKAFYKPLENNGKTEEEIEHARKEHHEAETLLEELTDESLRGAAWQQKFQKLKQAVEHHIEEEEKELFKDAKAVLSDKESQEMEDNMKKLKGKESRALDIEKLAH